MGFGGGNEAAPAPQVIRDSQQTDLPLQEPLTGQGLRMLNQAAPFSVFGAGHNLLPNIPFGQVFAPGPNPTIFGANPYDYDAEFFGGASRHLPPEMTVPVSPAYQQQQQSQGFGNNPMIGLLATLLTGDPQYLTGMMQSGGNAAPMQAPRQPGGIPMHPQTPASLGGSGGSNAGGAGTNPSQPPNPQPAPAVVMNPQQLTPRQPQPAAGPVHPFPGGGGGGTIFSALQQNQNPSNIWWEGYGEQAGAMKDAYMASQNNGGKPA